jgi:amino acid transporter
VSGKPISQAGVAAAVASTNLQVGSTLGVAILGALVTASRHGSVRTGLPVATHAAWWVIAGCALTILLLAGSPHRKWAVASVQRTADSFDRPAPGATVGAPLAAPPSTLADVPPDTAGATASGPASP